MNDQSVIPTAVHYYAILTRSYTANNNFYEMEMKTKNIQYAPVAPFHSENNTKKW